MSAKKKNVSLVILTISLLLIGIVITYLIKNFSYVGKPIALPKVEVRLPDRMMSVDFDSTYYVNNAEIERTTLLVWIDSTHCMPCSVDYLYDYEPLDKRLKETISDSVQIIAVLSPKPSELDALKFKLRREHFSFSVYIDESNTFQDLNPFFRNDNGELTVCTDRNGIYGLCKQESLFNIENEAMAQLLIYNLSLLHKFNYEGVVTATEEHRSNY